MLLFDDSTPVSDIRQSLFSNSEQGALYDLHDRSTLFQDAAGTTPWTTLGQPLGLQRDKSKGLVRSANLVTNGDFASATGWTAGAGWAIGSGVATATTSSADLSTDIGAVANRWYVVTFTVTRTAGSLTVIASGTATTTPTISASGTYTLYILASGAGSTLIFRGSGFSGTIDNVSAVHEQGNHRYQTTSASRPTIEARVNLCTKSEFPGGTADSSTKGGLIAGVSLPNWLGRFTTGISFGHDWLTAVSYVDMGIALASAQHTISVFVKMDDGNAPSFGSASALNVANDFVLIVSGLAVSPLTYAVTSVGDGVYRVSATITSGIINLINNGVAKYNTNSSRTFKVTGYQLELGSVATTYQRVTTATDYADIGAPRRIKYDGIDDFLQTAAVDFSATDKMTVWAGVRKLSDAATGVVVELSTNADSTNGTFTLAASVAGNNYYAQSRGTVRSTRDATGYVAPHSAVLVAEAKISTDILRLHVNNAAPLSSATDQGTGNYGNYPLYFGARAGTSLRFSGEVFSPEVIRGAASTAAQIDMVELVINRNMGGVY